MDACPVQFITVGLSVCTAKSWVVSALGQIRTQTHTHPKPTITYKLFPLSFMPLSVGFNLYSCSLIQKKLVAPKCPGSLLSLGLETTPSCRLESNICRNPSLYPVILYIWRGKTTFGAPLKSGKLTISPMGCSWIPFAPVIFSEISLCKLS